MIRADLNDGGGDMAAMTAAERRRLSLKRQREAVEAEEARQAARAGHDPGGPERRGRDMAGERHFDELLKAADDLRRIGNAYGGNEHLARQIREVEANVRAARTNIQAAIGRVDTRDMAGEHSFRGVDYESREARNAGIVKQWIEGPPGDDPNPVGRYVLALEAGVVPDEIHPHIEAAWAPGMTRAEYDAALDGIARDGTLNQWRAEARAHPDYAESFGPPPPAKDESMPAPTM